MAQAISREMESTLGLKIPFLDFLTGSEWARRAGEPGICDFVTGGPKEPPPPGYCEALQRWSVPQRHDWYGYKMNEREACRVVAASLQARYGVGFRPEQVSMTNGSLAALTVAMRALVDPGGEVAFFSPPWSGYEPMIIVRGAVPVRVKLQPPDFDLAVEALAAAASPRLRAVIVNSPHNPTGRIYPPEALTALS